MIALARKNLRVIVGLAAIVAFFGLFLAASSFTTLRSVEVGFSEISPLGASAGAIVPASCPSFAHTPGECGPVDPVCYADMLVCNGQDGCSFQSYVVPCPPVPQCPAGTTGTYPNCVTNPPP